MIASAKKITPLESFVDSFLRTHKKHGVGVNDLLDASTLISKKLGLVCCDNPPTPVPLHNRKNTHNQFKDAVEQFLAPMQKKGNVLSLQRTLKQIQTYLAGCCCTDFTIVIDSSVTSTSDVQVIVKDAVTGAILVETVIGGDATITACIPNRYFVNAPVNLCVNAIASANSECGRGVGSYTLVEGTDIGNTAYVSTLGTDVGLFCTGYVNGQVLVNTTYTLFNTCNAG